MAKFANPSKLSKEEQEKLLIQLCRAIARLDNPIDAARFLKDLLSAQEAEMLAKRFKAAELLIDGYTYTQIMKVLKIGKSTISRVHEWVKLEGDGFRLALEKIKGSNKENVDSLEQRFDPLSWRNIKRRYPLYYWPQLLLENVIEAAKKNDRRKIIMALKKMDKKTPLFKRINKLLKQ